MRCSENLRRTLDFFFLAGRTLVFFLVGVQLLLLVRLDFQLQFNRSHPVHMHQEVWQYSVQKGRVAFT
jgi:hypothetical protein